MTSIKMLLPVSLLFSWNCWKGNFRWKVRITPCSLKTAQDYAVALHVHVNYLNRAVKEVTGKSTTTHITERIASEAKALLQHTNWNIADIAYALGFEYPTYFNNFFKRLTGTNPKSLRLKEV